MLTKIEVYTERGDMLSLPLMDSRGGYEVKDVDGIGPNKATVVSTPLADVDGDEFQSVQGESRNIRIKLGYTRSHSDTVGQRRAKLYRYLLPKNKVTLRLYTDEYPVVEIAGVVESFDAVLFSQDPESIISIVCHRPAFVSTEVKFIESATVSGANGMEIDYEGSLETGIFLRLMPNRAISSFYMYRDFANGVGTRLDFIAPLAAGETLELVTTPLQKQAQVQVPNQPRRQVFYGVSSSSDWIQLYPGRNLFRIYVVGAPIPYTIAYNERFGGL